MDVLKEVSVDCLNLHDFIIVGWIGNLLIYAINYSQTNIHCHFNIDFKYYFHILRNILMVAYLCLCVCVCVCFCVRLFRVFVCVCKNAQQIRNKITKKQKKKKNSTD